MIIHFAFIVLGLVLLVIGGEWLVRASVGLALKLKVSTMVIGLTVVSFATSAPELIVSLKAALKGHPDITFGNVIGSNIANIGLILGVTAIILPINIKKKSAKFDLWYLVLLTMLLWFFVYFDKELGHLEGLLLLLGLGSFVFYKIRRSRIEKRVQLESDLDIPEAHSKGWKIAFFFLLGGVALKFGADFLVEHAVFLAEQMHIDERIISITVLAFGTSVPELAASVMAAFKKEADIAIGNVIGSNLFNIGAVLGITSFIKDIPLIDSTLFTFDFWWALAFVIALLPMLYLDNVLKLSRSMGIFLVLLYSTYIFIIIS